MRPGWAAVFDWDGVILDSSRHHEESWERLARETGRVLPEGHFRRGFGRRNIEIMRDMLGWSQDAEEIDRLSRRKEELYREVVQAWGIDPLPGVRAQCTLLLAQLKDGDSFQPIADRLHDETNFVALAAGRALAYLGREVTAEKGRCARALVKAWIAAKEPRKSAFLRDMLSLEPPRNYGDKEEDWLEWSLRLP